MQTFKSNLHYLSLVLVVYIVAGNESFNPDISATCKENPICNESTALLATFETSLNDLNSAVELPLELAGRTDQLVRVLSPAASSLNSVKQAMGALQHAPYVGGVAKTVYTALHIVHEPIAYTNTALEPLQKYVNTPARHLNATLQELLSDPDGVLGGVGQLIETALNFNTSMSDMCILNTALGELGGLIRPMKQQVQAAVACFQDIKQLLQGMLEGFHKVKTALTLNSTVLTTIRDVVNTTFSQLDPFWKAFGPVVTAISNVLNQVLPIDGRWCIKIFFWKTCFTIRTGLTIGGILNFVNGALSAFFNVLRYIPGVNWIVSAVEGLIDKAINAVMKPIIDKLGIPAILKPNLYLPFPQDIFTNPLAMFPNYLDQAKLAIGKRFNETKQQVKAALENVTDTVKDSLGLDKTCFSEADPIECVKHLAPSVNLSMPMPFDLESIMAKIHQVDIFPLLEDGLSCSSTTQIRICDYISNSTGCTSKLTIPVCTSLGFASSTSGKNLLNALDDFGAVAETRRRLSASANGGPDWSMIIYPGLKAYNTPQELEAMGKVGYKTKFVKYLNEKKHELPTFKYIDFGKTDELEIFEWQARILISFSNGKFQSLSFRPRIKFLKVSVHKLWEPKANWPEGLTSLVNYPIPKVPKRVGDTWEATREWVVGWLRRKINQGNHFDFSRLRELGKPLNLDFTKWDPLIEIAFVVASAESGPKKKNHFLAPDRGGVHVYWNNGLFEVGFALRSTDNVFQFPLCFSVMLPRWGEIQKFWPSDKSIKSIFNFLTRRGTSAERKNTFNAFFYAEWIYGI
uniref:Uncharacterized protein n=1 Tax=Mucochytrium quahogii TaxID=96639 RepID=A0A7S2W1M3_9STRA|mmetsp:Transcript_16257/g.28036  ORF Transcript_16257/g.28036 Transcript_16257/m.28036 type:complete len:801 (-) Transcript_16257:14-2416(-)